MALIVVAKGGSAPHFQAAQCNHIIICKKIRLKIDPESASGSS